MEQKERTVYASMSAYRKSVRLNELLKLALQGKTLDELKARCVQMGVTRPTMNNYIKEVVDKVQELHQRNRHG